MANTYIAISTVTVSSNVSSVTFSSIPQTYTDLVLLISARDSSGSLGTGIDASFNSSNATAGTILYGNGASAFSAVANDIAIAGGNNNTANTFSNCFFYIPNYTSSNAKVGLGDSAVENNATDGYVVLYAPLFGNATSAITSIVLVLANAGNFLTHSTFTLYGIKNS